MAKGDIRASAAIPPCPYCGAELQLTSGKEIYPHRPDMYAKHFYRCAPCDAFVGCHPGTINPLGSPANEQLRAARSETHAIFDRLWKLGWMKRAQAYAWLAQVLGIEPSACHIGHFDLTTCARAAVACDKYAAARRTPQGA